MALTRGDAFAAAWGDCPNLRPDRADRGTALGGLAGRMLGALARLRSRAWGEMDP